MIALEVFVDGKRHCLAGVGEDGVLNTIVNWVGRSGQDDIFMHVGGLNSVTSEHLRWTVPTIGVGSEILVRVIEVAAVDPPDRSIPKDDRGVEDDNG